MTVDSVNEVYFDISVRYLGLIELIINCCGITILFKIIPQYCQILCEVNIFL